MDYTQEQLDKMIADAVADAKKGLFTEDDLQRRVTSEVDRRVETGIQKGLETQRAKWEDEYTRKANLTAEELAKEQMAKLENDIKQRELEIAKRANTLDARDMLSEAGVPKDRYEKLLGMVVTDSADSTKANVTEFINLFTQTKTDLETQIKSELSKIPAPEVGDTKALDLKGFKAMTYAEKVKFKETNPEQYNQFMKQ